MEYIMMVIKESMRIQPIAHTIAKRRVIKPTEISDHVIPAGALVGIDVWAIHHDPQLYHDPLEFRHERFAPDEKVTTHTYQWFPFGGGTRQCRWCWKL
ncbi:cytochrome P450 [Jimgerdemannia flammicorona]|uniref:Cytochrome P450 n=1 Tax=Jimgerdemannia flammicorona TaxID=994334 RepID=A0A433CZ49_9FUNG|nr:cytochrome P450 [Jimgerdemannia flammicorona]